MKAMVVDDSSVMRRIHQKALEQLGYSVVTAEDGQQAVNALGAAPCDLIVTDLHMPVMDGIELIKNVRGKLNMKTVKILMVTSDGVLDVVQNAMNAGADDVLIKPFGAAIFGERVKGLLSGS
jgi:two-component system chemotaxis response regulator CheY